MKTFKNIFILPFISLLLFINLTLVASAATKQDVESFFKEAKSAYLQADDTFTYSGLEEKGGDRFIVKDLELYLAETKRLFKYDQIEFTFTPDATLLNSALSNILANGHTLSVDKGDKPNQLTVDQIEIEGTVVVRDETLLFPQSTNITSSKVAMNDQKDGFQAAFDELKIIGLKRTTKDLLTMEEVNISPFSGQADGNIEGKLDKYSVDGISLRDVSSDKGILFKAGLLEIGKMSFEGHKDAQDISFITDGFTGTNVSLNISAYSSDEKVVDDIPLFPFDDTRFLMKPMEVRFNGKVAVTTKEMVYENTRIDETQTYAQIFKIDDIFFDMLAAPQPPKNIEQLKALGLTEFNLSIDMGSTWDMKSGQIDIPKYIVDIKQMGAVNITSTMSGFTEEVIRNFQKIQTRALHSENPEQQKTTSEETLAAFSNFTIDALSIKVTDRDFLEKAMLISLQTQEKVDQMRMMAGPMVGAVMTPYKIPDFAQALSGALTTFMTGNKSIEFAINPEEPIRISELEQLEKDIKAQNIQPADLIKKFGITVKAE